MVIKQLFGFDKVFLAPGASTTLTFSVNASDLGLVDIDGHTSLHPGGYDVVFSRGCVECDVITTRITVDADAPIRLKSPFRRWW